MVFEGTGWDTLLPSDGNACAPNWVEGGKEVGDGDGRRKRDVAGKTGSDEMDGETISTSKMGRID